MQPPKFSTVVNAGGFEMLVKGEERAIDDALVRACDRLRKASGLRARDRISKVETLPRTGDNIRMRVTWIPNARA